MLNKRRDMDCNRGKGGVIDIVEEIEEVEET